MKQVFLVVFSLISCVVFGQVKTDSIKNNIDTSFRFYIDSSGGKKIYTHVDIESEIAGGLPVWKAFLVSNLNIEGVRDSLPRKVTRKGFRQTAFVTFTVCTDGSICDIGVENEVDPIIKNEVLRVMKKSPSWTPASINGIPVKSRKKQPITFVIE